MGCSHHMGSGMHKMFVLKFFNAHRSVKRPVDVVQLWCLLECQASREERAWNGHS